MSLKKCINEFVVMKSTYDSSERELLIHFLSDVYDIDPGEFIEKVNKEIERRANAELRMSSG